MTALPTQEREAERRQVLDPEDPHKAIAAVAAQARVEGPSAYTRLLNDRLVWNDLAPELQDQVISNVGESLGRSYRFVDTRVYECGGQQHRIGAFEHEKTGIVLHLLPGGRYMMGSPRSDDDAYAAERPQHPAVIDPFLCGRFPVTQREWVAGGGLNVSYFSGPDRPVEHVTMADCQAWLASVGGGLRLPSESEWEYACRAGTTTRRFWGDAMDPSYAWYGENSRRRTHDVRRHWDAAKWNAFGLTDMIGNVWEWCQDDWVDSYAGNEPKDSRPREGTGGSYRVLRGVGWGGPARGCRSACRGAYRPALRGGALGLRVVRGLQ